MDHYKEKALYEHEFWLEVLRDHSIFIEGALQHTEKEDLKKVTAFKDTFVGYLTKIPSFTTDELVSFSKEMEPIVYSFREYKLTIIERMLKGTIKINLGPTFVNHMVNEIEEYMKVLAYLQKEKLPPVFHELHHHLLWLLDASGHAGAIAGSMDLSERDVKQKSMMFEKQFNEFYLKAVEMAGFLRTNLKHFPALARFNKEVELEIQLFQGFLEELEEMEMDVKVLGSFSALMADHMFREEQYYLMKVAQAEKLRKV